MISALAITGPLAAVAFAALWRRAEHLRKVERESMLSAWDTAVRRAIGEVRVCRHMLETA